MLPVFGTDEVTGDSGEEKMTYSISNELLQDKTHYDKLRKSIDLVWDTIVEDTMIKTDMKINVAISNEKNSNQGGYLAGVEYPPDMKDKPYEVKSE